MLQLQSQLEQQNSNFIFAYKFFIRSYEID